MDESVLRAWEEFDADGAKLLTSGEVGALLEAAVAHAGGQLANWALDHVDSNPALSTTATYCAQVEWPYGKRMELLGVSARVGGPSDTDITADIFADGEREVAVWLYPHDPDLPGLRRAAYAESMADVCNEYGVFPRPVHGGELALTMIGYRPRRRAVVKVTNTSTGESVYVKVLRAHLAPGVVVRQRLLSEAGGPAAGIRAVTDDHLLILDELAGESLAEAIFDADPPCTAEDLIGVLDSMPAALCQLERRPPWTESIAHYAAMVAQAVPALEPRVTWLAQTIAEGLAGVALGWEPTHGDFHEGQLQVASGKVTGLLDVDTAGPGRRADDLACLVAHLSTVQRMNATQQERVHRLVRTWVPVFDTRVDPVELRLRAAAVIVSLATGPFRGQEPDWQRETELMVGSAQALVRQVA